MLPKNLALITMFQQPKEIKQPIIVPTTGVHGSSYEVQCEIHSKKLEAFCEDDRTLLCIDCILLDGHKAHDISPIPQSSEKERSDLHEKYQTACTQEEKLNLLSSEIANFRADLTEKANLQRGKNYHSF